MSGIMLKMTHHGTFACWCWSNISSYGTLSFPPDLIKRKLTIGVHNQEEEVGEVIGYWQKEYFVLGTDVVHVLYYSYSTYTYTVCTYIRRSY